MAATSATFLGLARSAQPGLDRLGGPLLHFLSAEGRYLLSAVCSHWWEPSG